MWENIDRKQDYGILESQNDKLERQFGDVKDRKKMPHEQQQ